MASPTDKTIPAHHHHHHHHGPRPGAAAQGQVPRQHAQSPVPQIPPKTKTTVSSQAVLDAAARYKRHHLGDFIYDPGLKPQRLLPNTPLHRGFSSNPKPLPWDVIKGKINCILTVKISRVHLSPLAREEITARGYLWGTDVYTDDSDVVAACIHGGWIRGEWNDEVDVTMLDLDAGEKRRKNKDAESNVDLQSEQLIAAPPSSGPMAVPADRDLHVNVLILPKLPKYAATTRFGISSREFGGEYGMRHATHDGLSYMVQGVRWVENGAQPQARLRGKARRERMRKAMQEVRTTVTNLGGIDKDLDKERVGEITGNWWRKETTQGEKGDSDKAERRASEGDKENQLAEDKAASEKGDVVEEAGAKDVEMDEVPSKETAAEADK